MLLKIFELINLILCALVAGLYWGPWLALTRSIKEFEPNVFLAIVHRLNKNMAPIMTVLSPLSLLSNIPVLILSYPSNNFYFTMIAFLLFTIALLVTVIIEVPIVKQIITWTSSTLPNNWKHLRDRWEKFHIIRVVCGILGIGLLIAGILF
jgi:hypothetical protein